MMCNPPYWLRGQAVAKSEVATLFTGQEGNMQENACAYVQVCVKKRSVVEIDLDYHILVCLIMGSFFEHMKP